MAGAETFCLKGTNQKAVLLLHGYTGTTSEMRPLGEYLHAHGYTVLCPRLPGHGTSVQDLEQTTADEWRSTAIWAAHKLLLQYDEVYVAGLSMGGLLAMYVASKLPVKKAVFISAPIYVCDRRVKFLPILKYFIRYLPKHKKNYHEMDRYCLAYKKMPTKPLTSLFGMLDECKKLLPQIKMPSLILQSTIERTVKPKSAQYIYDHIGTPSENKKLVWYNKSGHILTLDVEHEQVYEEILNFYNEKYI